MHFWQKIIFSLFRYVYLGLVFLILNRPDICGINLTTYLNYLLLITVIVNH